MVVSLDLAFRGPFCRVLMGETAENLTEDYDCQREDMDVWSQKSQLKWSGKFGQRAKMYPTRTNGYENDEETELFRQV